MARVKVERLRADTTLTPQASASGSTYVVPEQQTNDIRSRLRADSLEKAFSKVSSGLDQFEAKQRKYMNDKKSAEALYEVKSNLIDLETEFAGQASQITNPEERIKFWDGKFREKFPHLVAEDADPFVADAVDAVFNEFKLGEKAKASETLLNQKKQKAGSDFAKSLTSDIDAAISRGASQGEITGLIEDHLKLMAENNTVGLSRTELNAIVMEVGRDEHPRWQQIYGWASDMDLVNTKTPEYEVALDAMRSRRTADVATEFAFQFEQAVLPLVGEGRVKALEAMMADETVQAQFQQKGVDIYKFFDPILNSARTNKAKAVAKMAEKNTLAAVVQQQLLLRRPATQPVEGDGFTLSKEEINRAIVRDLKTPRDGEELVNGYPPRYWANITYFQDPELKAEATSVVRGFNQWGGLDETQTAPDGTPVQKYQAQTAQFMDKMRYIEENYGKGVVLLQLGEENYNAYRRFVDMASRGRQPSQIAQIMATPKVEMIGSYRPDFSSLVSDAGDGEGFGLWDTDAVNEMYIQGELERIFQDNPHWVMEGLSESEINDRIVSEFRSSHTIIEAGDRAMSFPLNDVVLMNKFGEKMYTPEIGENLGIAMKAVVEDVKKKMDIDDDVWIIMHPNRKDGFVIVTPETQWLSYDQQPTISFQEFRTRYYDKVAKDRSR